MLLLLSWSAHNYYGVLTAKLYDYLSAGRPILVLVNGPEDPELKSIVEGTRAGRVFPNETSPKKWLSECYQNWAEQNGRLPWSTDRETMSKYLKQQEIRTGRQ
jgi:hypothetical protein